MDNLFSILKSSESGCRIGQYCTAVHGNADDHLLLCPPDLVCRRCWTLPIDMPPTIESPPVQMSNLPRAKRKGIIFSDKALRFSPVPINLDGIPLPWVEQSKYLENRMASRMDGYSSDIREKRAQFITRNC